MQFRPSSQSEAQQVSADLLLSHLKIAIHVHIFWHYWLYLSFLCTHVYGVYTVLCMCVCGFVCTCVLYTNVEARDRLGVFLDHFQSSFLTQERSLTSKLTNWLASWRSSCLSTPSARVTEMCYLPGFYVRAGPHSPVAHVCIAATFLAECAVSQASHLCALR